MAFATLMTFCLVVPVSALYFDFEYFETDQMTYEVGETINMIAKMSASYDEGGWCYVSFAVVTDQGPVFDDTYYINSSPDLRYFTSFYTIMPNDTSPFPDPIVAYVIFNVEIFDKYSQGVSENIEVNITRGRVQVRPHSSLSIEANSNTSLSLSMASRYNESVAYSKLAVSVEIYNYEASLVFDNITTTDAHGYIQLDWDSIPFPPGTYTIQVSGNGTSSFHPFSDTLVMTIEPEFSSINVIAATENVYCQTPSGMTFDSANIIVEHVDKNSNPIDESNIEWKTNFANGSMISQGNGMYSTIIPFTTTPGMYQVNISAFNAQYQNASNYISVEVIPRNLTITITNHQILASRNVIIAVTLMDWQSGELIESLPVEMNLVLGSWQFNTSEVSNSSGIVSFTVNVPSSEWGIAELTVNVTTSLYYRKAQSTETVEVLYIPQIFSEIVISPARGESALIHITILDPLDFPSIGLEVSFLDTGSTLVASGFTDSNGIAILSWLIPLDASLGLYNYTILVEENSQYAQTISILLQVTIHYPLWFSSSITTWNFIRGSISEVGILLESEEGLTQSIGLVLNDSMGEFLEYIMIPLGILTNITINIDSSATTGTRVIEITVLDSDFVLINFQSINVTIIATITSAIDNITAFYDETLEFNLLTLDDTIQELEFINLNAYQNGSEIPFASLENVNATTRLIIPLPQWITPGTQQIIIELFGNWTIHEFQSLFIVVWIRTSIAISITTEYGGTMIPQNESLSYIPLHHETALIISSGVINSPPPILFNATTSTEDPTTRETSPTNCPRFNSGTSIFFTVSEKDFNSESGNGQIVRSLIDLKDDLLSIIASSTDLEVLPKEITPHSAFSGPDIITSERRCLLV